MQLDNQFMAVVADGVIPVSRRIKFAGTFLGMTPIVSLAGAGDVWDGVSQNQSYAANDAITIKLRNAQGTFAVESDGAFAAMAPLYGTANGRVDDAGAGGIQFYPLQASTLAGQRIQCLKAHDDITPADTSVTTAKLVNNAVTDAKLSVALQDRIVLGTVTLSNEVAHARTVTIQLTDNEGNALAEKRLVRLCVNATAACAVPAATATDTFTGPTAGTIQQTVVAKADYWVMTDATGKYVFVLTHNDAGTSRYLDVFADSRPISGTAAFDAV